MKLYTFQCIVFYISAILSIGYSKYFVKKMELCDKNINYPNKVYARIRMVDDKQLLSANISVEVPIDDSVRVHFTVDMLMGETEITHLVNRTEINACTTMHKYFGEFAYDIERRAGLIPGMCPISKGTYHLHDYPLNLDLIPVQGFPFGNLRFRTIAEKRNNVLICTVVYIENRMF